MEIVILLISNSHNLDSMLLLKFNQWFNVMHQCTDCGTGANVVVVFGYVREHGIDVLDMEGSSTWKS